MKKLTLPGLIIACIVSGLGLFIGPGLSSLLLFPWVAAYLVLLFRVSYDAYVAPPPVNLFPFTVLGVLLLNFLVQVTGGVHSSLWAVYFLYAVLVAAVLPPRRAYAMVTIILAIETANALLADQEASRHWHVYAGFGLSLVAVSAASSHIMFKIRRDAQRVEEDHRQLIAHADALDPLADPNKLKSLMSRQTAGIRAALQREISFNGLIDMISPFVPAHSYAVFVRERRDRGEVFVLRAAKSSTHEVLATLGTELDPDSDRTLIDICAEQRQRQYLSDIADLGTPLSKLGYYRQDVPAIPVRSFLVVPVMADDLVVAIVAADSLEPGAFSVENQDTLACFAPFFIQTIENIQMALDLKTRADHFGALHEISADLTGSLRFDEIMEQVIPRITTIVPADYCACVIAADQTDISRLRFAALSGFDEKLAGREFALADSAVLTQMHALWRDRGISVYHSPDLGDRGREINLFPFKEMRRSFRTLYGRLLVAKDAFLGAFFLGSFRPDAFNDYHRDVLLDTLINQISMVAYNSLLFQRIENMARTDGLTGLLNHRTFMEKLGEKYRELERNPHSFSILLMDIDKFKGVNDKYGHPVGDLAIKAVAQVLRETVRGTDFVARYGGEEFAVGMIETDSQGALQMAERLRSIMEKTVVTRVFDGELKVTLSIGVVSFPEDGENRSQLVTMADEALYHAKRTGRNRACLYRDAARAPLPAEHG